MKKSRRMKWLGFIMCGRGEFYMGEPGRRNHMGLLEHNCVNNINR
jgi:hypothetical protein